MVTCQPFLSRKVFIRPLRSHPSSKRYSLGIYLLDRMRVKGSGRGGRTGLDGTQNVQGKIRGNLFSDFKESRVGRFRREVLQME